MSKSSVKLSGRNSDLPRPLTTKTNVRKVLQEGQLVNKTRCQTSPAAINVPCNLTKNNCSSKDFSICKILWPEDLKYPKCKHKNGLVLERNVMSSEIHCSFLAIPKKRMYRAYPRWIEKKIPSISIRVNELAQPNPLKVINNFHAHLDHLSIFQIENYLKQISKGNYASPRDALQMMKRSVEDRKSRMIREWKNAKKLKAKLDEQHGETIREVVRRAIEYFLPLILNSKPYELSENAERYSRFILIKICQLLRQNVPERNSTNIVENVLIKIADKIALLLIRFIDESNFKNPPTFNIQTCKGLMKKCYPIELIETETEEESNEKGEDKEEDNETGEGEEGEDGAPDDKEVSDDGNTDVERKLSFLRASQIDFSGINCKDDEEQAQKQAEKASKAAAKEDRKRTRDKAKKAKKDAKNKSKEPIKEDCRGDVNKKPQWNIEWVDRS